MMPVETLREVSGMKLDRLLSILVVLLRKERVQARELAEMFEVSVRTILRDVEAINMAGIPVVTYQGAKGGIGVAEGFRLDRSALTADEMAAVISALNGVARTMPDSRHSILMEKFKNTLPAAQQDMLADKVNRLVIDLNPWGGEPLKGPRRVLQQAIEDCREISFIYSDVKGSRTQRTAEPYSLVLKGQKWYLYAWCLLRGDFRLFKLSRIKDLAVTEKVFERRAVSLEELPWDKAWPAPDKNVEVELVFDSEMESIIEEWFGDDAQVLEDGRLLVRAVMPENNWLYGFILSFGAGVEVASPRYLRRTVAEIAYDIYKKYS